MKKQGLSSIVIFIYEQKEIMKKLYQNGASAWIDQRLTTEAMNYLWDSINIPVAQQTDIRNNLAGNISKSYYIQDTWFYENVLKQAAETLYFRDWANYYNVHIAKGVRSPVFKLNTIWVNYQKQHEFNPPHGHEGMFSFVVFMKIPTHWKEQHALPWLKGVDEPYASDFQFLLSQGQGPIQPVTIPLCPEDEGRMLFFPAWLYHQVFPFYNTKEERITVSGNIIFDTSEVELDRRGGHFGKK